MVLLCWEWKRVIVSFWQKILFIWSKVIGLHDVNDVFGYVTCFAQREFIFLFNMCPVDLHQALVVHILFVYNSVHFNGLSWNVWWLNRLYFLLALVLFLIFLWPFCTRRVFDHQLRAWLSMGYSLPVSSTFSSGWTWISVLFAKRPDDLTFIARHQVEIPTEVWKTALVLIPCFAPCPAVTESSLTCQMKSRAEVEEEALEVWLEQARTC